MKIAEKNTLEICELAYAVGPAGSSEAVGAVPCLVLWGLIAAYTAAM